MSAGEVPCRHGGYHQVGHCPEANEAAVSVGSEGDSAGITEADCEPDLAPTGWSEWDSVVYLLGCPILRAKKAVRFVELEALSIDWDGLEEASAAWSHGERLMVALARDLWNSCGGLSMREFAATLDDANFSQALRAIELARGRRDSRIVRVIDQSGGGL